MTARPASLVLLAALASACAPAIRVPVLQPSLVTVPSDIQVIGVIDRSAPKNAGETVLGTIEGILTGEGIMGDREGAAQAVSAMVVALAESPRFQVVSPNVSRRDVGASLFDTQLDFRTVQRICRQAGCDALLSLEAFDSNSALTIDGNPIDPRRVYTDPTVTRDTRVLASWRLYDAHEDRILDEARDWARQRSWSNSADTLPVAIAGLPSQNDAMRMVGAGMGAEYSRRIAPTWVTLSRKYYGGGDPQLVEGKHYARASEWEGAKAIWQGLVDDPRPRVSGKAHYNLALAYEVEGDLPTALVHAKQAAVKLHNKRARDYVRTIDWRIADQKRLEQQLAPPANPDRKPGPAPEPRPGNVTKPPKPSSSGDTSKPTMSRPR